MFDYYFAIVFFAIFIMIIMLMMMHNNELLDDRVKRQLRMIAILVMVTAVLEWTGVQLDRAPIWTRMIHIAVKVFELSLAPAIAFECANMVGKIRKWEWIEAFLLVHAVLEVISGFAGFIFYVDQNNVYHQGTFYWIYLAVLLSGIALFCFMVICESRHHYGAHKAMLLLLPFFTICGLALQYLGETVRVIWLCCSVDVLIIYILYVEVTQNTDALTHLMNRRYYENRITSMKEAATVFYFDVDDFKHVNDTYGHRFGDVSLATLGRTIYAIFSKIGYCYRIGGDEFAAIAYIPVEDAEKYCEKLFRAMEVHRMREPKLPFISVGYAFYDPKKSSIADVINEADAMMYERKRKEKKIRK